MRLPLRVRFALLAAVLVLLIASLVGTAGYLSFRASLLARADRSARTEANRLAGLVASSEGGNGQAVDLTDTSLTGQLSTAGLLVSVIHPTGAVVQASAGRDVAVLPSAGLRRACLASGRAQARRSSPPLAVACERVGAARAPVGAILVGVPLSSSLASLRRALILGVLGGGVLACVLSLLLAGPGVAPVEADRGDRGDDPRGRFELEDRLSRRG